MEKSSNYFFLYCLISVVGVLLYWHSENLAEEKLQDYMMRLEDDGFTIEERHLADFNVDWVVPIHFFRGFPQLCQTKRH